MRLWMFSEEAPEGKFLVQRRDGSVPEWPYFVLGARDPAAVPALLAYAEEAKKRGFDAAYVRDVMHLAWVFGKYREQHGDGDPDAPPHRKDDPETVKKMAGAKGA